MVFFFSPFFLILIDGELYIYIFIYFICLLGVRFGLLGWFVGVYLLFFIFSLLLLD